jgi:acyl carrier protein
MPDDEQRLRRCFSAVFPTLTPDEIAHSTAKTTAAWDSLASLTLLRVVEEEFGVEIDPLEFAEISSFNDILEHIANRPAGR